MGIDYSGARATPRLDLGAAIMEFVDQAGDYIGTRLFPVFKASLKSAKFSAITRETLTQVGDTKRATRGNYNRGRVGARDNQYSCEENGWENPLGDEERKLYQNDFDAELAATKAALGIIMRGQELRITGKIFNTATFTGTDLFTDNSASPWTNVATDAIQQVRNAKAKVRINCGMEANALVLSQTNIDRLKSNAGIKDAIKYTARLTDQEIDNALADLFGVKYILKGRTIRNTSKEGKAFSGADIWSALYAMVAIVVENGQDLTQPGIGRTFLWTEDCPENVYVEQYRDEDVRSDVFRIRQHTDEKLIDPYFGHLMKIA